MTPDATRVFPHNLDAEKAVLGAILVNGQQLAFIQARLKAEDFFRVAHQILYAKMIELSEERKEIDLITLLAKLDPSELAEVGGPAYITSLTDGVPRSSNAPQYADLVVDAARRRSLIRLGLEVTNQAYESSVETSDVIHRADQQLLDIARGAHHGRLSDLRVTFSELLDDIELRHRNRGQLFGIDTGFASINDLTQGWQKGDMIVLAARPSIGKTALVLNMADAAAATGKHVLIFSLEMRRQQLEYRRLSHLSQVQLSMILGGHLSAWDHERLAEAAPKLTEHAVFVDDRAAQTVADIRASCRSKRASGQLDLVIVDYIQLMSGSSAKRGATRNDELSEVSRRLKILADEIACPVIVLSQLNRAGADRSDKRPQLTDLRDTGALEQDADLVCFLHRVDHREDGDTSFIIEKQRNGPTGTVTLTIHRHTQTFLDGPEQVQPSETVPDEPTQQSWYPD